MTESKITKRKPDYNNVSSPSSLPFTAPTDGFFYYILGSASGAGTRTIYVNSKSIGDYGATNTFFPIVLFLSKGDIVSSNAAVWGSLKFIPFT